MLYNLFAFFMSLGNAYFMVHDGLTLFTPMKAAASDFIGSCLAVAQFCFFAPGGYRFLDRLFRFKYGK